MKRYLFIGFLFFLLTTPAYAHPGRTDSNGCHRCLSCEPYGNLYKWEGQLYEYYHCHDGNIIPPVQNNSNVSDSLNQLTPHEEPVVVPPVQPKPTITLEPIPTIKPLPSEEPMPTIILPPIHTPEPKSEPVYEEPEYKTIKRPRAEEVLREMRKREATPSVQPEPSLAPVQKQPNVFVRLFKSIFSFFGIFDKKE